MAYVDKSIEINAPPATVWTVLTDRNGADPCIMTVLEPGRHLRYTLADAHGERPRVDEDGGIECTLSAFGSQTRLHVQHGDFSTIDGGDKYRRMSEDIWSRVLPQVKQLAESAGPRTRI